MADIGKKALLRIAERMSNGEVFYSSLFSPQLTCAQLKELNTLGFDVHIDNYAPTIFIMPAPEIWYSLGEKDEIKQAWCKKIADIRAKE